MPARAHSYVYILLDPAAEAFKIGISANPTERCRSIPHKINLQLSFQLRFAGTEARKAEAALHFLFRRARITRPGCGGTEWFRMHAYPDVVAFVTTHRDALGWLAKEQIEASTLSLFRVRPKTKLPKPAPAPAPSVSRGLRGGLALRRGLAAQALRKRYRTDFA